MRSRHESIACTSRLRLIMPVTTRAATVAVKQSPVNSLQTPIDILKHSCPDQYSQGKTILATSFSDSQPVKTSRNGFVRCALHAYLQHNHLVIRPEDVWFAILTQFSFYVNSNAEELRHFFVEHEGKKKLEIVQGHLDLAQFAKDMTGLIAKNIKDQSLKNWIMPNFSTTTEDDEVVASIIMMGTMKKYFACCCGIICGIPSVTLLGEKKDWENILQRLEFLATIPKHQPRFLKSNPYEDADEMHKWYGLLKPIISNFILTFDAPDHDDVVDFWLQTIHQCEDDCSGDKWITGWINAFCFWDTNGKPLAAKLIKQAAEKADQHPVDSGTLRGVHYRTWARKWGALDVIEILSGFAHAPVHVKVSAGSGFVVTMLAGSLGWRILDSNDVFVQTREKCKLSRRKRIASSESTLTGSSKGEKATSDKLMSEAPAGRDKNENNKHSSLSSLNNFLGKLCCARPSSPKPHPSFPLEAQASSSDSPKPLVSLLPKSLLSPNLDLQAFAELRSLPDSILRCPNAAKDFDPSAWELGGEGDMLQPVTGWIAVVNEDAQYGKDENQPDMVIDSDAENYDPAVEGKTLRD